MDGADRSAGSIEGTFKEVIAALLVIDKNTILLYYIFMTHKFTGGDPLIEGLSIRD